MAGAHVVMFPCPLQGHVRWHSISLSLLPHAPFQHHCWLLQPWQPPWIRRHYHGRHNTFHNSARQTPLEKYSTRSHSWNSQSYLHYSGWHLRKPFQWLGFWVRDTNNNHSFSNQQSLHAAASALPSTEVSAMRSAPFALAQGTRWRSSSVASTGDRKAERMPSETNPDLSTPVKKTVPVALRRARVKARVWEWSMCSKKKLRWLCWDLNRGAGAGRKKGSRISNPK